MIVVANEGQRIDIPDGCILENSKSLLSYTNGISLIAPFPRTGLLSGNLNMIVRIIAVEPLQFSDP